MPTVVLDTNVLVAAGFRPDGASARLVRAVLNGELRMVWDGATRGEIEHIVSRIPPLRSAGLPAIFDDRDRYAGATLPERFEDVADPADRPFAALAHAAGAVLVSSDDHLLSATGIPGLTVLTPAAFWCRFRDSGDDPKLRRGLPPA